MDSIERMVYKTRKQWMACMERDYSKCMPFQWKIKWQMELLGVLRIMGEMAPLIGPLQDLVM